MIKEAIIIAGGQGTRLMPLTNDRPKALVLVDGIPLIQRQVAWLTTQNVEHIIVACGFMHEKINRWKKDFTRINKKVSIELSFEDHPLGTGGAVKKAMDMLHYEHPFVCLNCDDLTDIDLKEMEVLLNNYANALGVMAVANPTSSFGVVSVEKGSHWISGFEEKSKIDNLWVNCGVYVLKGNIYRSLPDIGMIESYTFPKIPMVAYKHLGKWCPITSPKDVVDFSSRWNE